MDLRRFIGKPRRVALELMYPTGTYVAPRKQKPERRQEPKKQQTPETQPSSVDQSEFLIVEKVLEKPGAESPTFVDKCTSKQPEYSEKNADNLYVKVRYNKNPDGTQGEFSGFVPDSTKITNASLRQLTQFLFRVTHGDSGGSNDEGLYRSEATKTGLGAVDFFDLPNSEISKQLHSHEVNSQFPSHFISTTDSGVTAITYALRLEEKKKDKVLVHIMDTMKIENLPLFVHAYPMMKGYRVCSNKNSGFQKMIIGAAYTEFLVWDELKVEACSAELSKLIEAGLLELPLGLKNPIGEDIRKRPSTVFKSAARRRQPLFKLQEQEGVEILRENYYSGPWQQWKKREWVGALWTNKKLNTPVGIRQKRDIRWSMDTEMMNRYMNVAECFEKPRFQFVMLMVLLSMSVTVFDRESILDELMMIPHDHAMLEDLHFYTTGLLTRAKPEVRVSQELFVDFVKRRAGSCAVKKVFEARRILVRLDDDPKTDPDNDAIAVREEIAGDVTSPQAPTKSRDGLTRKFLEEDEAVDSQDALAHNPAKKRKLGGHHELASKITHVPLRVDTMISAGMGEKEERISGAEKSNNEQQAGKIPPTDRPAHNAETLNKLWTSACQLAASQVENTINPVIDVDVDKVMNGAGLYDFEANGILD